MIYDVAVIGAGPAGSTCALALGKSGLRVALLDKADFPRDKVCGDAIPALCGKVLQEIDPSYRDALQAFPQKTDIASCRVVAPAGHAFEYHFQTRGWCAARLDFDDFLFRLMRGHTATDCLTGQAVHSISGQAGAWEIKTKDRSILAKLIVGADGANGVTAGLLAQHKLSPDHHCAAVRAYYQGVEGLQENRMEIHLIDAYLPGYFWIFPVGGGRANVGFGMMRNDISRKKLSLRHLLPELIAQTPALAARFAAAIQLDTIKGFGLPLGARRLRLSGDGFLLCGDAASLVEPATGEGIGNAMYSGLVAAQVAGDALAQGKWDAESLKAHDARVYGKLYKGMRQKYLAQKFIGGKRRTLNFLIRLAARPGAVQTLMRKIF